MDELTGQVSSQVTRINLVYSLSFVPADITRLCQEIWILQTCLDLSEILRCDLIIYFHNHDELYAWNAKFWSNSSLLRYNFSRQNKRLVWNDQKNMTTVMDKISKIAGSILPSKTSLQTPSLYRLQGSPCVVILPCKDPVKITGYHSNPSSSVVGT